MEQTPLRQALQLDAPDDGRYTVEVPSAIAFIDTCLGGIVMAIAHKAAADIVSRSRNTESHTDLLGIFFNFFRPVRPSPQRTTLIFKVTNLARARTTLHVEVMQAKLCSSGYITMGSLSVPGHVTSPTDWALLPPPLPTTVQSLESGDDPNWFSYHAPFDLRSFNKFQAYMKYHIPVEQPGAHIKDQWIEPGWADDEVEGGAVWTNELVHFALDNGLPLLHDIMSPQGSSTVHEKCVAAGRKQRAARLEGRNSRFWGEGLSHKDLLKYPFTLTSVSISTDVAKLIPKEGTRWLFMRAMTKGIREDRMDHDIILMDSTGDIIAHSHHVVQLIPVAFKANNKNTQKQSAL